MSDGDADILPFPGAELPERDEAMARGVRIAEAIVFASGEPVPEAAIAERLGGADVSLVMETLERQYAARGVNLVRVGPCWAMRTAPDLAFLLQREAVEARKLGRAAIEVLAIIAYHQPATRAEIEAIRGVATSKGTLDTLMEHDFVRMRGRRRTPGRPVTYGTTLAFLDHFGLASLRDLPGVEELRGAGLLQADTIQLAIPQPDEAMDPDEDPLDEQDVEALGILPPGGSDEDLAP